MRSSRRHPLPAADDRSSPPRLHRGITAPPDRPRRIPQGSVPMKSPLAESDRDRLIEAMLPEVAFDGWSHAVLRAAAKQIEMPAEEALALFPRGAPDLVAAFSRWADRRMLDLYESASPEGEGTGARVKRALGLRIEVVAPWREAVRRALAVLAMPPHAP